MTEISTQDDTTSAQTDKAAKPLYRASVENEEATIVLRDRDEQLINLRGEILVAGHSEKGQLFVEGIQQITLHSEPLDDLGGVLSLAGPVNQIKLEPEIDGRVEGFEMRMYYPNLSNKHEPACQEFDAIYPQVETLRGRLMWKPDQRLERGIPRLHLIVTLDELVDPTEEAVESFSFTSSPLSFQLPMDEQFSVPKANSLSQCGPAMIPPSGVHRLHELHLRFVAVGITNDTDLENKVKMWLEGACEVWCRRAGIIIVPQPAIDPATSAPEPDNQRDPDRIEVYLVDNLSKDTGGGVTIDCGKKNAYIRLDVEIGKDNKYLLAHELGHVLGIYHPGHQLCATYREGSLCSVMEPHHPDLDRNTMNNIGVIELGGNLLVGNARPFKRLNTSCDWQPNENTRPVLLWQVWNSKQTLHPFYDDNVLEDRNYFDDTPVFKMPEDIPNPTPPRRGLTNHICVRLNECQLISRPVQVYLYLGVSGQTLQPLNNNNGPHLVFAENDADSQNGRVRTRDVAWEVPDDYPADCQVFAVAIGNQGTSFQIAATINQPTQHDFDELFALSQSNNNDVTLSDLHIEDFQT